MYVFSLVVAVDEQFYKGFSSSSRDRNHGSSRLERVVALLLDHPGQSKSQRANDLHSDQEHIKGERARQCVDNHVAGVL